MIESQALCDLSLGTMNFTGVQVVFPPVGRTNGQSGMQLNISLPDQLGSDKTSTDQVWYTSFP